MTDHSEPAREAAKAPDLSIESAAAFLIVCAEYFERRPTNGEDAAHWANVSNGALCRKIATMLSASPAATRGEGNGHPDDIAVDRFAAAMKAKLAKKRAEGYGGWDLKITEPGIDGRGFRYECQNSFLSEKLREHVEKGDPVDVANFAMMIHQRGERIADERERYAAKVRQRREANDGRPGGWAEARETCQTCQGNGEIITDWDRYMHSHEMDAGDEATDECPDCNGEGTINVPPAAPAVKPVAWLVVSGQGRRSIIDAQKYDAESDDFWISRAAKAAATIIPLYAHPAPAESAQVKEAVRKAMASVEARADKMTPTIVLGDDESVDLTPYQSGYQAGLRCAMKDIRASLDLATDAEG